MVMGTDQTCLVFQEWKNHTSESFEKMGHSLSRDGQTPLFNNIPDTGSMTCEPKTKFTEEVMETAMPLSSTIELWLWAEVSPRPTSNDIKTHCPMICLYIEHRVVILKGMGGILPSSLVVDRGQVTARAYVCDILNDFGCVRFCGEFVDVICVT